MKKLQYIVINGLFLTIIYLGVNMEIQGALNILYFISAFYFIFGILAFIVSSVSEEYKNSLIESDYSFGQSTDAIFDISVVLYLVWFGFMWVAISYGIGMLFAHAAKQI